MKFALLITLFSFQAFAGDRDGARPNYQYQNQRHAVESAERGNRQYVEDLIDREVRRHRENRAYGNFNNCGTSYWTKREARGMCPAGTVMKVYDRGDVFYTCDCE